MNSITTVPTRLYLALIDNFSCKIRELNRIKYYRILLSTAVTILMVLLPVWLYINNLTLSTHFEESVGFRYFHSLRVWYGNELPWLPQGQLPGLLHILIQNMLTLMNHPVDEIFPRVDIFTFWAVIIPLVCTGFVYNWATKPIKSYFSLTLFALIFIGCFFSPRYQDGWMLLPDYHIWMVPLALIAIGWCIRLMSSGLPYLGFTNRQAVIFGIYAGMCLSVKFTLFTYPMALGLIFMLLDRRMTTILRLGIISISVAILTWSTVLTLYYKGSVWYLPEHYRLLFGFTDSQVLLVRDNSLEFFKIFIPLTFLDLFPLIPAMLLISLFDIKKYELRTFSAIIIPTSLLELYMLYQRNYTHTNIEVQYLFYILLIILSISIYQKSPVIHKIYNYLNVNDNYKSKLKIISVLSIIVIPSFIHFNYTIGRVKIFTGWIAELNVAGKGIQAGITNNNGKTLFLIPITASVDEYNLRTIDNGLFKSATGLGPFWDEKAYVASVYTKRWYASNVKTLPNLEQYSNLVYRTKANESLEESMVRLESHYATNLSMFNCLTPYFKYTIPTNETLVFCTIPKG